MAQKIIYTKTDEAPALATFSLLPIVKKFLNAAGIEVESRDISVAARILSAFPDYLNADQKTKDALAELGELAKTAEANIIKLPNISASMPQLLAAIDELQAKGFAVPNYPSEPKTELEKDIKSRYDKVKGSAVNPVLREGNSDRRAPKAVKEFAKTNPHSMGFWSKDSRSHVSSMTSGDFATNEKSLTIEQDDNVKIVLHTHDGEVITLKESTPLIAGEVIDGSFMSKKALIEFLEFQINEAKAQGVLFSLHMKATMMKVSDPIIFGHAVRIFFKEVFSKYDEKLSAVGANPNDGLGKVISQLELLPPSEKEEILKHINEVIAQGPDMAYVNSDKGITNLHVPSDVIIDASMPAMIRTSGQMWDSQGKQRDTKAVIPDSSYADLYSETIAFCKANGAFDPRNMGTVPNVGLMAQKAEEYGSHDKTFEIPKAGVVKVINGDWEVWIEHEVEEGDIWRMCQVKDAPIKNWIELAVERARATNWPAVFWLDQKRAHDRELIKKVENHLQTLDTEGLEIHIKSVAEATKYTLERVKNGQNTISVTGNVLRDYLTDLFPILELGTSAKMLSIVPLMNGGGLFETGAGGSAPKHVQQFVEENHLRWDSLGEFLALAVSLEHIAVKNKNAAAKVLAETLDLATEQLLMNGKSPSRKVNELDNRGSHFYLAKFWSKAIVDQTEDQKLALKFQDLADYLERNESQIVSELNEVQGQMVNIDGYYFPNEDLVSKAMRPSETLNQAFKS